MYNQEIRPPPPWLAERVTRASGFESYRHLNCNHPKQPRPPAHLPQYQQAPLSQAGAAAALAAQRGVRRVRGEVGRGVTADKYFKSDCHGGIIARFPVGSAIASSGSDI